MKKKIDVAEDALVVYPFPPEDLDLLPRLRIVRVHNTRIFRLQRWINPISTPNAVQTAEHAYAPGMIVSSKCASNRLRHSRSVRA